VARTANPHEAGAPAPAPARRMSAARLEAFSDAVVAISITIMVLELRPPAAPALRALRPRLPVALAHALSFTFLATYWNNHHHLLRAADGISGPVMWANMHLLFWLSLVPFATAWVGQAPRHAGPAAVYGAVAFLSGAAYSLLVAAIEAANPGSRVARAVGADRKGKLSLALDAAGALLAFATPWLAYAAYVLVSAIWFIPDRRLEGAG
jgi:uncharacterized membrane protein